LIETQGLINVVNQI